MFRPGHPDDERREREIEEKKRKLEEKKRKRKGDGGEPAAKRRQRWAHKVGSKQQAAIDKVGAAAALAMQKREQKREQKAQLLPDCSGRENSCYMAATVQVLRAAHEFSTWWHASKFTWARLYQGPRRRRGGKGLVFFGAVPPPSKQRKTPLIS